MRHYPVIAGIVAALTSLASLAIAGPKIACEQPVYDFGTVPDAQTIEHTFVLTNAGDAELVIGPVRPACGCTTAGLSANNIPPGGNVELKTVLSLQGKSGAQDKAIMVHSNDPDTPQFRLAIKGTIERAIDVRPQQALLEIRPGNAVARAEVQIIVNTPEPHQITGIDLGAADFCTAELRENRPGHDYTLSIETSTNLESQATYRTGSIALVTDHPQQPRLNIPVIYHRVREVVLAPNMLTFDAKAPLGTTNRQTILVRGLQATPIQVVSVTAPSNVVVNGTIAIPNLPNAYGVELVFVDPGVALDGQSVAIQVKRDGGTAETYLVPIKIQNN